MYVLCFTRPRYQVSVNRTIGPLVSFVFCGVIYPKTLRQMDKYINRNIIFAKISSIYFGYA